MSEYEDGREVPPEPPLLYPIDEGARLLGVSRSTFYRYVVPCIPILRIGRSPRIRRSDLEDFIAGLGEPE